MKGLLYFHQLPQNILGSLISKGGEKRLVRTSDGNVQFITFKHLFYSGISLGDYIILDSRNHNEFDEITINHEYGHQKQSRILGWLYLPTVGLVSMCRNIWDRIFHSKWNFEKRAKWYYSHWPENKADEFGGVRRNFK